MRRSALAGLLFGLLLAARCPAGAQDAGGEPPRDESRVEIVPILGLQVLGGQNFYSGQASALAGNASGLIAPAIKLNERWSLLPSLTSSYSGTRQVMDLVAGGALFQSQWDNIVSLKAVYGPESSRWRLKPHADFKAEFLREAAGEQMGQGLYDYRQADLGLDAEFVYREPFAARFSIDYFGTHFPNYTSLESQAAVQFQGQDLARELVGDYVLDSRSLLLRAEAEQPLSFGGLILEGRASFLDERFPNQRVVDASGGLTAPTREDAVVNAGATLKRPWDISEGVKALGSLGLGFGLDNSNQSSYDASQTRYLAQFYNYNEVRIAPDFKLYVGPAKQPVIASASASWTRRVYPHRSIQDAAGAYLGTPLRMDSWTAQATVSYPMAEHFSLLATYQYGRESSNQQFLQLYQYNFTASTYMFGFSYDY